MRRFLIAAVLSLCTGAAGSAQDIPLSKILVEGESWKLVTKDLPGVTFLEGNPSGVLISQNKGNSRLHPDGKIEPLPRLGNPYRPTQATVPLDQGGYGIVANRKAIATTFPRAVREMTLDQLTAPSCLTVWPGGEQLVIGDAGGKYLWTAPIKKSGELGTPDRYYLLRVKAGTQASGVTAMTMDAGNLLYACTPMGVQVFDPTGRLCGVILAAAKDAMTAVCLGGEKGGTLYVACGDRIYSRAIQSKAVFTIKKE